MPQLRMYPAKNGDSFLVRTDSPEPLIILVDGGFVDTFRSYIHEDLKTLSEQGYRLNLVVATHIDTDHISGLIELLKKNGSSSNPKIIHIDHVWHNSVRSMSLGKGNNISPDDRELLDEIKRVGFVIASQDEKNESEISAREGSSLAALLLSGGYSWNEGVGHQSINCEESQTLVFDKDAKIQVIGPRLKRLEKLKKWWMQELRRYGFTGELNENKDFDDAFEFLCANKDLQLNEDDLKLISAKTQEAALTDIYKQDRSVTNASSIAFIATINKVRLLFLGDALAEDTEEELTRLSSEGTSMVFDAIKISHHGSLHSTSPSLLQLIDAPIFLISSNGQRHNHPDVEVLKEIVDRPSKCTRKLYFNYSTEASQELQGYKSKAGENFIIFENSTDWIDLSLEASC